jgi:adenosylcobinamide-GDP ribazoletransferase
LILAGGAGLLAVLWAGLVTVAVAALARAKIGGQTGDILGATQQMAEIAVLASLLA